ncbi:MAG: GntR family transcriptional regulator [Verrucomicrobia bacterium]|nr:GntR family transcriptional regulator [Verrucomicrobiota bacterium]
MRLRRRNSKMANGRRRGLLWKRTPLYLRLENSIKEQIARGDLRAGDLAPSENELIAEFKVSSITARRCLNDLAQEGVLRRVQGKGTFVRQRDALKLSRHIGIFYHELVTLTNAFASSVLKGIFDQAGQGICQPELLSWGPIRKSAAPASALMELLRQRRVDGMLIMSPAPLPWFDEVLKAGVPVVSINFEYDHPGIFSAVCNLLDGIERLKAEFIRLGHRRMVAIKETFGESMPGVVPMMGENVAWHPIQVEFETVNYHNPAQVEAVVEKHLSSSEPASLFFVSGYELALQVRHFVEARGVSVPRDVSLVVLGVSPGPSDFFLEAHPAEAIAAEAARMLGTLLAGHVPMQRVARIPTRAMPGKTLQPAK